MILLLKGALLMLSTQNTKLYSSLDARQYMASSQFLSTG